MKRTDERAKTKTRIREKGGVMKEEMKKQVKNQKNVQDQQQIQAQQEIQDQQAGKRVSMRFYLRADDSLKIEGLMKALRERGWKREKIRLQELIIDELFLKSDNKFYEDTLNKLTPLEYLFKTKLNNPSIRSEIEKILKRKV